MQDASDRARQVTIETDNLKKSVNSFRQGLQGMLKQQLDMVENPEWSKLNDSTSTEKLKQEIGDQANGTTQDYQPNVQNNENMQDQVSKSDQMNYNDNIQNDQPDESYTINHQQNEPTFNFQDDADGDSKEN
ncbi:hypothetical protein [Companilactobacillus paralimentarius]|uniref:hypothetical protein n=1 Tax=Companilactobacillus paralimentarius TaxID=83526 RepID=UPI000B15BE44|nr:hypothetical protein [Companilactobacillus paralimentarius]